MTAAALRAFHNQTRNVRGGRLAIDGECRLALDYDQSEHEWPSSFKSYPVELERVPMSPHAHRIDTGAGTALCALTPRTAPVDVSALASSLAASVSVARITERDGVTRHFRVAPSAGGLHPVETYVVTRDLTGVPSGVYHVDPRDLTLVAIHRGDHRAAVASAVSASHAPATYFVLTGVPWRTCWNYRERGYRHVFWDAGAVVAHVDASMAALHIDMRFTLDFDDIALGSLLKLPEGEEFPVAVLELGAVEEVTPAAPAPGDSSPHVLGSGQSPMPFPLVVDTHREAVQSHRNVPSRRHHINQCDGPPALPTALPSADEMFRRRGSTRVMKRDSVARSAFDWIESVARASLEDLIKDGTACRLGFAVQAVEGMDPGLYFDDTAKQVDSTELRQQVYNACLDQHQAADAAFVAFTLGDIDHAITTDPREYRDLQLAGGVVLGRAHLAAFALGLGATGLTFFDDEVSALFETTLSPVTAFAVGIPGYASAPLRQLGEPIRVSDRAIKLWAQRRDELRERPR